jgi:hypothetical protein
MQFDGPEEARATRKLLNARSRFDDEIPNQLAANSRVDQVNAAG